MGFTFCHSSGAGPSDFCLASARSAGHFRVPILSFRAKTKETDLVIYYKHT